MYVCKINWSDYKLWIYMTNRCVCMYFVMYHSMAGMSHLSKHAEVGAREWMRESVCVSGMRRSEPENHMHTSSQCIDTLTAYMFTLLIMLIMRSIAWMICFHVDSNDDNIVEDDGDDRDNSNNKHTTSMIRPTLEYMVKIAIIIHRMY